MATEQQMTDFPALLGEFRRRTVLVPVVDGGLMSAEQGELRWLYAFTSEETFADFVRGRGGTGDWAYARVYGAELLGRTGSPTSTRRERAGRRRRTAGRAPGSGGCGRGRERLPEPGPVVRGVLRRSETAQ